MNKLLQSIAPFMGDIEALTSEVKKGNASYVVPALRNMGSVAIPLVREIISPASFRNAETEITDIDAAGARRVRAVANKFKYGERQRGLQVLRYFGAGGACPQNKTEFGPGQTAGDVFDMNSIVFGDSTDVAKKVLPVKAAALFSDAVSIRPYIDCVDATFHNRASEDGTLFDGETKANSNNLFERSFVKPGTLLVQTIVFNGRTAPVEALEHLLLCIGLAGAYGGQTSINGINVRTHLAGIFAAPMERDIASPYVLIEQLDRAGVTEAGAADVVAAIEADFKARYQTAVSAEDASAIRNALIAELEDSGSTMKDRYQADRKKISAFFDAWFDKITG